MCTRYKDIEKYKDNLISSLNSLIQENTDNKDIMVMMREMLRTKSFDHYIVNNYNNYKEDFNGK